MVSVFRQPDPNTLGCCESWDHTMTVAGKVAQEQKTMTYNQIRIVNIIIVYCIYIYVIYSILYNYIVYCIII